MSVVSSTKTRNFARHCLPSPRCIDGYVRVRCETLAGETFQWTIIPYRGKGGGGGGGSNTAPSCYMLYGNLVTLRVGHLGLKWVLTLFILLPFIKTIAVKYRVRYIPRSKLFSLRGTGSMTSHIMWQ